MDATSYACGIFDFVVKCAYGFEADHSFLSFCPWYGENCIYYIK